MAANECTHLLSAQQNGNGVLKKKDKLIILMPKDPIFVFEDFWGGMELQELLPYQDDPWWQRLRNIILYSFWLVVLLTFATACFMAYAHRSSTCKILNIAGATNSLLPINAFTTPTMLGDVILGKMAT